VWKPGYVKSGHNYVETVIGNLYPLGLGVGIGFESTFIKLILYVISVGCWSGWCPRLRKGYGDMRKHTIINPCSSYMASSSFWRCKIAECFHVGHCDLLNQIGPYCQRHELLIICEAKEIPSVTKSTGLLWVKIHSQVALGNNSCTQLVTNDFNFFLPNNQHSVIWLSDHITMLSADKLNLHNREPVISSKHRNVWFFSEKTWALAMTKDKYVPS